MNRAITKKASQSHHVSRNNPAYLFCMKFAELC